MNKQQPIVDQIADVVGKTTKHYEYKKEFQDPIALAAWVEDMKPVWQRELLEELENKYGDEYGDGCGCCETRSLGRLLREKYLGSPTEEVNND